MMWATFNDMGTQAWSILKFTICEIVGARVGKQSFNSLVGIGSSSHDFADNLRMRSAISSGVVQGNIPSPWYSLHYIFTLILLLPLSASSLGRNNLKWVSGCCNYFLGGSYWWWVVDLHAMGECPLVVVRVVVTLSGNCPGVVVWVVLTLCGSYSRW